MEVYMLHAGKRCPGFNIITYYNSYELLYTVLFVIYCTVIAMKLNILQSAIIMDKIWSLAINSTAVKIYLSIVSA